MSLTAILEVEVPESQWQSVSNAIISYETILVDYLLILRNKSTKIPSNTQIELLGCCCRDDNCALFHAPKGAIAKLVREFFGKTKK